MKFTIGYQLPDEYDSTLEICRDYRDSISGVYFSYGSEPSGRLPLYAENDADADKIKEYQLYELREISRLGIPLTLLLNAACYGEGGASKNLKSHVVNLVGFLREELGICAVTTASPFIAESLKEQFGDTLYLCASVNMRIDNISTMRQLSAYFDGYYLRKEVNRDLAKIRLLSSWCRDNGKGLHLLANSGCLGFCGFQSFHDNLVAHQKSLPGADDCPARYPAPCHEYLASLPENEALATIMQSTFIRPEDVWRYGEWFSEMKLATRMHSSPRMVVAAYARGRFVGNLTDLTEPSYSTLFKGTVLDNTLLEAEWFDRVLKCEKNCHNCNYCKETAERIKVKM